jgi:Mrp family chromosome partitioning ATPase
MGRIYKALAKNLQECQPERPESTGKARRLDPGSRVVAEPENYRYAGFGFGQPTSSRVIEFQSLTVHKPAITEADITGLLENVLAESSQIMRPDIHRLSPEAPRHLQIAPATAPVFAEPNHLAQLNVNQVEPHLIALTGGAAAATESYRTLAVRLLNMASSKQKRLKTLVVTSARAGEGKTTVAANLAWIMAKLSERRVLLIDANLQNPSVFTRLGLTPQHGWLDMVDKGLDFAEAATRLDPNGLYLLAPRKGEAPAQAEPLNAIASSEAEKIFEELAADFDFIVIDAPAVLDSADAQRLVSITDGTVMVARAGHTPHTCVTEALKSIPKERRVGVVLNEAQLN